MSTMKNLYHDLNFTLRGLRRRPGFTLIAALTLAIGIGATVRGILVGVLAGLALGRLIEGLLFGVEATDSLSLSAACLTLSLAVFFACLLPALRAARLDPLTAIRGELS